MGTNTDPYQRAEGRYRLMPGIIDALARSGTPFSILTKGTVLAPRPAAAARPPRPTCRSGSACRSRCCDRELQARLEPGTPSPAARLDLVRRITDAGLPCGVMVAPVLPLLTDSTEALDALLDRIAAAGRHRRDRDGAAPAARHPRVVPGLARPRAPARWSSRTRGSTGGAPTSTRSTAASLAERVAPLLRRHGLTGDVDAAARPPGAGTGACRTGPVPDRARAAGAGRGRRRRASRDG